MDLLKKEFDYKWDIGTSTCTKEKELDWTEKIFGEKQQELKELTFKHIENELFNYLKKEQIKVIIIVLVRILKYAPATPLKMTKGRKITIVLIEDPIIAGKRKLTEPLSNSLVGFSGNSS